MNLLGRHLLKCQVFQTTVRHKNYLCSNHSNIILCNGQGGQSVGMLKPFATSNSNINKIFKLCNETFKYDFFELCQNGPIEKLTRTLYCQPAMAVSSLIGFELLKESMDSKFTLDYVAGFSLGEIPALYISGLVSIDDVFKILKVRAEAMDYACRIRDTGMVTLEGLEFEEAEIICEDLSMTKDNRNHFISVAAELYEKCTTIGGSSEILNRFINKEHSLLKKKSVKITKRLADGAFHTKYMLPAVDKIHEVLRDVKLELSDVNLFCNVTGRLYQKQDCVHDSLLMQIIKPVLWNSIMRDINAVCYNNTSSSGHIYDVGAGKAIKTMAGKFNKNLLTNYTKVFL